MKSSEMPSQTELETRLRAFTRPAMNIWYYAFEAKGGNTPIPPEKRSAAIALLKEWKKFATPEIVAAARKQCASFLEDTEAAMEDLQESYSIEDAELEDESSPR